MNDTNWKEIEKTQKRKSDDADIKPSDSTYMDNFTSDMNEIAPHMRRDYSIANENIENKKTLCGVCGGTGNYLYSMYQPCSFCRGSGAVE